MAVDIYVVTKSVAWYAYEGEKIGQGRENAKNYLEENPEIMAEIEALIRQHYAPAEEAAEDLETEEES